MSISCDYCPPTSTVCKWWMCLASVVLTAGYLRHPTAGKAGDTAEQKSSAVATWGIWLCGTVIKLPCEVLKKGKEKIAREMP